MDSNLKWLFSVKITSRQQNLKNSKNLKPVILLRTLIKLLRRLVYCKRPLQQSSALQIWWTIELSDQDVVRNQLFAGSEQKESVLFGARIWVRRSLVAIGIFFLHLCKSLDVLGRLKRCKFKVQLWLLVAAFVVGPQQVHWDVALQRCEGNRALKLNLIRSSGRTTATLFFLFNIVSCASTHWFFAFTHV